MVSSIVCASSSSTLQRLPVSLSPLVSRSRRSQKALDALTPMARVLRQRQDGQRVGLVIVDHLEVLGTRGREHGRLVSISVAGPMFLDLADADRTQRHVVGRAPYL